jgi:amino acid adenylation domain-containing protein
VTAYRPASRSGAALFAASFAQRGLWLAERLNPGSAAYVVAGAARLRGRLDPATLRQAFEACLRRHESLRTAIVEIDGAPWQAIETDVGLPFQTIEVPGDEAEALSLAGALARQPFELADAPLLRVRLIRLAEDDAILALAVHHIVFDGWSMTVLLRDLAALYERRRDPSRPALPALPIQFADFSEWQHERIAADHDRLAAYWRDRLASWRPPTLPGIAGAMDSATFDIASAEAAGLRRLAQTHAVTPVIVLLATLKLLLQALTGQADQAVGVPVAQRERREVQDMIGPVANTVVLRTRLDPETTLDAALAETRAAMLGALAHAELPFDVAMRDHAGRRDPVPAMFAMQPQAMPTTLSDGLRIEPMALPAVAAKTKLMLEITECGDSWRAVLECRDAARTAQRYRTLLRRMTEAGDGQTVADLLSPDIIAPGTGPQAVALAAAWTDLLGQSPRDGDDFFAQGGHSLLAARLLARVGADLPLSLVFDHPRFADLARAIAATAPAPAAVSPIQPISRFSAVPLSSAQLRLWFMQQLEPDSTAYTLFGAVRLDGRLDIYKLRQALQALQLRHEALRTKFREVEGRPLQVILPSAPLALPVDDLGHLDDPAQQAALARDIRAEAAIPFDLTEAPLLRTRLVRLHDDAHVLLLGLHHIVGDGWSIRLLWRDLAELYAALVEGRPARLPDLAIQYADYAQWQSTSLPAAEMDRLARYWRGALAGCPVLDLPTDFPRPPMQREHGARFAFAIPEGLSAGVATLAGRLGATPFMVWLAGFQALLARYSGQTDIAVGVPVACRDRGELQEVVGCFVNTLVLRGDLSGEPDFAELVRRTRALALAGLAHQHLPFEKLVELLQPGRDLSRHALFQVLFDYQDDVPGGAGGGITVHPIETGGEVSQFDLALYMEPDRAAFTYRADLFSAATVARLADAFCRLIEQGVAAPDRPLSPQDAMTLTERRQLRQWNDTAADLGPPAMLDALIAQQAARTPDAPAIRASEGAFSYGELMAAADRLAARLRQAGAGPDRIVAVCLDRGLAMPVVLLAVLRAGAAYLPLDPAWPRERLDFALADAAPVAVVTSAALRGSLPPHPAVIDDPLAPGSPAVLADIARSLANLAYVIYTSGSTGAPKGAMIPHAAIVNRLRWMQLAFDLRPGEAVLQKTPYGFDVSVWEFFWPLLAGATLVVAPPDSHRDPAALAEIIAANAITTLHFVPSMLETFLAVADPGRLASLRRVIVSGEALTPELRERFFAAGLRAGLHNLYGPTEAAVDVTAWTCQPDDDGKSVPIGRPIANVRIHVLDAALREVPIGVPGEICIGGVAVGRGYLNRPELTEARFVADPFSRDPVARLYRTGDRGRLRADGVIEYLGRIDHQVKLRGWRIELGEIEAVLRRHPRVREAAVILRGEDRLRQSLVGFVTTTAGPIDQEELRRHAAAALPEIMVPSSIRVLPALPLSANGKLDRGALAHLPLGDEQRAADAAPLAPPVSGAERLVASVWRRVLERPDIGLHDNFFDLGGNSLLLVQVHARLRDAFERKLTLVDLFRLPTVARLAAFLAGSDEVEPAVAVPPPTPALAPVADRAVAIVGMAGRFPGAADIDAFWDNLLAARDSIQRIDPAVSRADGADPALLDDPAYVPAVGALDGIDRFDAGFFGVTPAEAARLDPQGRLLLECAWTALEDAGIDPGRGSRIGVFAGGSVSAYGLTRAAGLPDGAAAYQLLLANDKDYLPLRISYRLGLSGPSIAVQTACSSSLVAVCQAVRSLLAGDCDAALAGGVSVAVPHRVGYRQEQGSITAPDGVCRAFDADASGTVPGNGVGLVVLKRLTDALGAGDTIRAVIRGVAVTNDGADKVGFTAPAVDGQMRAITGALAMAGVAPAAIGFVEAHGTGTPLGDQVELTALSRVFPGGGDGGGGPVLGSVKTNIGHLDAASGVAGLIKATLAVQHGVIPPTLHFARPHKLMRFAINTRAQQWSGAAPRLAGVSSFGLGGTDAHVVIEQPPPIVAPPAATGGAHILPLSARSRAALAARVADLAGVPDTDLAAVAWTLQTGRRAFAWRLAIVAGTMQDAREQLARAALPSAACAQATCHFLFPGQGAQRIGMGSALYRDEPVFRAEVDGLLDALEPALARTVRDAAFAETSAGDGFTETAVAQPALFALSYALARLLIAWGVRPGGMLGHSLGEFVAATLAGVFRPADAIRLVALRGRLMQALPPGRMVQVALDEAQLADRMGASLSVAAVNDPAATVVAGPPSAVAAFCEGLTTDGIAHAELRVSHAFHSAMMDPAVQPFAEAVGRLTLTAPSMPFVSGVTGRPISPQEACDPAYWAQHLRQPVLFAAGLQCLAEDGPAVWLEVGPGHTLSGFARRQHAGTAVATLPLDGTDEAARSLRGALAKLWEAGVTPDWTALYPAGRPRKLRLPTYPFESTPHWLPPAPSAAAARSELLLPGWQRQSPAAGAASGEPVLLLAEPDGIWLALAEDLAAAGAAVRFGTAAGDFGDAAIIVAPASAEADGGLLPGLAALAGRAGNATLVLLTQGAEDVTGNEAVDPTAAGAAAAALVLAQETPGLRLRVIDCDTPDATAGGLASEILRPDGRAHLAIRGGFTWKPAYGPLADPHAATPLRQGGVVLVTGAAGRFGQAVARHLAARHAARLVLVSRRPAAVPDGVEGVALVGDIAAPAVARAAVVTALDRFGALHGVVHAAGLTGAHAEHAACDLTAEAAAALFRPKLAGTLALAEALAGLSPDFVLLVSSLSTVLGGPGFTAYAAANRAMERAADAIARDSGQRWISVAWDGLSFDPGEPSGFAFSMPRALALLDRIVASGIIGRVAAVAGGFAERHSRWVERPNEITPQPKPDPEVMAANGPRGAMEETVAALWQALLGHRRIGRDDNFFALGGDSLTAIRMVSSLRRSLGVPLGFDAAMTTPTIAGLAAVLDGLCLAPADGGAMEDGEI